MAKEDIQLKISAAVESAEAAKSLGQLRKSLMEIQSLQAEVGDESGAQFDKLTQAANAASAKLAETRDRIGDIQDKNRTLEGTPIERLSGSFGLLKESILNLDFDKAKIGAEGLLNTFTPVVDGKLVTGLAGVKGAFGMLGDGVKSLGSTFMSVGKALLTNPLFLLAAAIIAIVAVVILIMDKLGILKKIMDALGYAVGLVVKAFEALTDWLGLTTHAQEANAASAKKNGEEQRKQIDATATAQKNLAKLTEGLTQEEVDAFRKKAGIKDALNKNSFDIEKTRLIQTQETLANEIQALEELQEAGGELTDEQLKDLEQRKTDYDNNAEAIKTIEYQKVAYIQNLNKTLTTTLEGWKVKNMANDVERAKAQAKLDKDAEIRKIDAIIREAQLLGDSTAVSNANEIKKQIQIAFNNDILKINKVANEKEHTEAVNAAKKIEDKKKAETAAGIIRIEERRDQRIAEYKLEYSEAVKSGADIAEAKLALDKKTILAERTAIDQSYKFRKENEVALGFFIKGEKDALARADARVKKIYDDQMSDLYEKEKALQSDTLKNYQEKVASRINLKISEAKQEYEIAVEAAKNDNDLELAKNEFDNKLIGLQVAQIINNSNMEVAAAQNDADKIKEIRQKAADDISTLGAQSNLEWIQGEQIKSDTLVSRLLYDYENTVQSKEKLTELEKAEKDALFDARSVELSELDLSESEKAEIKERYRQLDLDRIKNAKEREMELNQKAWKNGIDLAQKANAMTQALGDAIFAWKKTNSSKTLAQQKKDAENQFNLNRALQVSTAIITGIGSVMSAFANGMKNPIPLLGPATAGVYAAIAGITAAANIAKIMATRFDSSAFAPPTDTAGGGGGGGTPPAAEAPTNFQPNQFFGLGQQTAVGMPGGPKPIKVYVSEGDIREVSERVSVIETRAVY